MTSGYQLGCLKTNDEEKLVAFSEKYNNKIHRQQKIINILARACWIKVTVLGTVTLRAACFGAEINTVEGLMLRSRQPVTRKFPS